MGGKKGGRPKKAASLSVQASPQFPEKSYLRRCWKNTREQWGGHRKVELGAGFIAAIGGGISGIAYAGFTLAALGGVVVGACVGFLVALSCVFLYYLSLSPKRLDEQGQNELVSMRKELSILNHAIELKSAECAERLKEWHTIYGQHLELQGEMDFAQNRIESLRREAESLRGQLDDRATRKEDRQALTLFSQAGSDLYDRIDSRSPVDSLTDVRKWANDVEAYLLKRGDGDESSVLLFRGLDPDIPRLDTSPHNGDERSQEALQRFMKNRLARLRRFISETRY